MEPTAALEPGIQHESARTEARRSRRALLAGALAGIGGWAATTIGRAQPALAANGDVVHVGDVLTGSGQTQITTSGDVAAFAGKSTGSNGTGLVGWVTASNNIGYGVVGRSDGTGGAGVRGMSTSAVGVSGRSDNNFAVLGESDTSVGVGGFSYGNANGVEGHSSGASASGVHGENLSRGYGIAGRSNAHGLGVNGVFAAAALGENTADGVGVWARSQSGVALYADAVDTNTAIAFKTRGISRFDRSGKLTITAGHASVTKTGIRIESGSLVLATLQQDRSGIWVRSAVPNATGDSFTIRLNKAVSADTKVAWFIVN